MVGIYNKAKHITIYNLLSMQNLHILQTNNAKYFYCLNFLYLSLYERFELLLLIN